MFILDISQEVAAQYKFVGKRRVDPRLQTPRERELVIEEGTPLYQRLRISNTMHDHIAIGNEEKKRINTRDEDGEERSD